MQTQFRTAGAALAASVSILAMSTPALAQQAPAEEASKLDEIVVTAQKREQNLQDVPIAISAIGRAKLEQLQIEDARDLSGLAPNLTISPPTTNFSAAVISIRGIPSGAQETFGLDLANAVYVDGIYIARSSVAGMGVLDLERAEVLRGPQGTLFGRNTTGGAISFISRKPSQDFQLRAEAGYGNFNAWNGKLTLDTGELFGGLKTSFSYAHSQRDGTVDNILEPRDSLDPGARKSDAFRAAFLADLGGTGSIQYIFDWARIHGAPPAFQLTNTADGTINPPIVINGQPVVATQQAPVEQYLAAATFLEPGCAALGVPTRVYRDKICLNSNGPLTDKSWGHNLQIRNDFGGFAVKLTGGYRQYQSVNEGNDLDGLGTIQGPAFTNATLFNGMPESLLQFIPTIPAAARPFIAAAAVPTTTQDLFDITHVKKHKQFSTELEVSGDSDLLDWVVGGFYFWEKGSEYNPQTSAFILDTNSIFLANFGPLGPGFAAANPARYRAVVTPAILDYTATNESKAIYGQTTIYPGGRDSPLSLTVGARYTWDSKKMVRVQNGAVPLTQIESGQDSFRKLTWNLMARYEFTPEASVYARAATGYRSGGFNAQDPVLPGTTTLPNFKPETVTSYEVGVKSELFDRRVRLNIAGYYNIYDDLAVIVPVTDGPPGTFASRIGNAGKVTYAGIEADLQAALTDNFSIDGTIGYIDIKTKTFMAGQSTTAGDPPVNIASVVRPTYTAPLTANVALNARFPVGAGGAELVGRVGYTHEDGRYSFASAIASPFNDLLKSDPRDVVDAQLAIEKLPLGGGEARVMLWVKNLTNAHDFVRGIDFGPLGYAGGYYADPRTYGVTLGMKF
ncbi:TonB-dependent receptor [Sphingopyxis lindanitolerans]|uniref:TonB-dependent receptor n=1 Tax=Sphingopyxis lindanitolerans TaxID=2054227 RepID=A0A2S8B6I5_9SPHN|nr:TonB-dependent receptor [Sphingopyxis lindanitolerans]PQM28032.1 TonB-dependent receptor [Sphingopyxis lindanitolerans]